MLWKQLGMLQPQKQFRRSLARSGPTSDRPLDNQPPWRTALLAERLANFVDSHSKPG